MGQRRDRWDDGDLDDDDRRARQRRRLSSSRLDLPPADRILAAEHRHGGHALCWHHPQLWGLLPEGSEPQPTVPAWPQFMRGCVHYRESLDRQLPDAPRSVAEYEPDDGSEQKPARSDAKTP